MFKAIRDSFNARAGKVQAEHEINLLSTGFLTLAEFAAEPDPRLKENGGRTPYSRAYHERWRDEGYRDALAGRIRFEQFGISSYDFGWIEGMRKRRKQGFRHNYLDTTFTQLVRRYHEPDLWPLFGIAND